MARWSTWKKLPPVVAALALVGLATWGGLPPTQTAQAATPPAVQLQGARAGWGDAFSLPAHTAIRYVWCAPTTAQQCLAVGNSAAHRPVGWYLTGGQWHPAAWSGSPAGRLESAACSADTCWALVAHAPASSPAAAEAAQLWESTDWGRDWAPVVASASSAVKTTRHTTEKLVAPLETHLRLRAVGCSGLPSADAPCVVLGVQGRGVSGHKRLWWGLLQRHPSTPGSPSLQGVSERVVPGLKDVSGRLACRISALASSSGPIQECWGRWASAAHPVAAWHLWLVRASLAAPVPASLGCTSAATSVAAAGWVTVRSNGPVWVGQTAGQPAPASGLPECVGSRAGTVADFPPTLVAYQTTASAHTQASPATLVIGNVLEAGVWTTPLKAPEFSQGPISVPTAALPFGARLACNLDGGQPECVAARSGVHPVLWQLRYLATQVVASCTTKPGSLHAECQATVQDVHPEGLGPGSLPSPQGQLELTWSGGQSSAPVSRGAASFQVPDGVGAVSLTFEAAPPWVSSASTVAAPAPQPVALSLQVTCPARPVYGTPVTCTVQLQGPSGAAVPTAALSADVEATWGSSSTDSTSVTLHDGAGTFSVSGLPPGPATISVSLAASVRWTAATAQTTLQVQRVPTTLTMTCPAAYLWQSISCTVQVSAPWPGAISGTVSVQGSGVRQQVSVQDGLGQLSWTPLQVGSLQLQASFSGTPDLAPSQVSQAVLVRPALAQLQVSCPSAPQADEEFNCVATWVIAGGVLPTGVSTPEGLLTYSGIGGGGQVQAPMGKPITLGVLAAHAGSHTLSVTLGSSSQWQQAAAKTTTSVQPQPTSLSISCPSEVLVAQAFECALSLNTASGQPPPSPQVQVSVSGHSAPVVITLRRGQGVVSLQVPQAGSAAIVATFPAVGGWAASSAQATVSVSPAPAGGEATGVSSGSGVAEGGSSSVVPFQRAVGRSLHLTPADIRTLGAGAASGASMEVEVTPSTAGVIGSVVRLRAYVFSAGQNKPVGGGSAQFIMNGAPVCSVGVRHGLATCRVHMPFGKAAVYVEFSGYAHAGPAEQTVTLDGDLVRLRCLDLRCSTVAMYGSIPAGTQIERPDGCMPNKECTASYASLVTALRACATVVVNRSVPLTDWLEGVLALLLLVGAGILAASTLRLSSGGRR